MLHRHGWCKSGSRWDVAQRKHINHRRPLSRLIHGLPIRGKGVDTSKNRVAWRVPAHLRLGPCSGGSRCSLLQMLMAGMRSYHKECLVARMGHALCVLHVWRNVHPLPVSTGPSWKVLQISLVLTPDGDLQSTSVLPMLQGVQTPCARLQATTAKVSCRLQLPA